MAALISGGSATAAILAPPLIRRVPLNDGSTVACIAGLSSIMLSPANSTTTFVGGAPTPIPFTATGLLNDGTSEQLSPGQLTWTVSRSDDTPPGSIANGSYMPFSNAGGVVTITATDGCITGTTTITLHAHRHRRRLPPTRPTGPRRPSPPAPSPRWSTRAIRRAFRATATTRSFSGKPAATRSFD